MRDIDVLESELQRYTTDSVERVELLIELSEALHIWDSARALKLASQALKVSERLMYRRGIANSLSLCALCHMYHGDNARALEEADTALHLFENDDDEENRAAVLSTMGTVYSHVGEFQRSLELLQSAIELESTIESKESTIRAYLTMGSIYHKLSDYAEALHYHHLCLELSGNSRSTRYESFALSNIGAVYFDLGEYSTSIAYYQRSLNIYQHSADRWGEAFALEKMGMICSRLGGLEDALVFHRRSMVLRRENRDKRGLASSLYLIGEILSSQNFDAQALVMYQESLELRKQTDDKVGMAETYLGFASVHIKEDSPVHNNIVANDLLLKCLTISSTLKIKKLEMRAHELLTRSYRQIKLFERALMHMERCLVLREEIAGEDVVQRVKQLEIALIREKSEREAERNRLENVELAGALQKVEALNRHLEHLNQEKNDLLSIVFHDLKNPIAGILLNTSTLERYMGRMNTDEVLSNVQAIATTASRMKDIVTHLLELNKIDSGEYALNVHPVNLTVLSDIAIRENAIRARAKSMRFTFEHDEQDVFVLADPKILRECIENYLSNALKYSPVGQCIEVNISSADNGLSARFAVRDFGVGISADDQKKLFSRYSMVGTKTTGGEDSSGLGLNSVRKFIELMNGSVGCISEVGQGSTFYFDLPAASAPDVRRKDSISTVISSTPLQA